MDEGRSYTWRFPLLAAYVFSPLILAILTFRWWLLAAVLPPLVMIFASALYMAEPILDVSRDISKEAIVEGESVEVTVSLTNRGARLRLVKAFDVVPRGLKLGGGTPLRFTSLRRGEKQKFSYVVSAKRGMWVFDGLFVDVEDPLGLFTVRKRYALKNYLTALPRIDWTRGPETRARETRPTAGNVPSRRVGEGVDFHGLRNYAPEDPLRIINWKATARLRQLISNEFESERRADVIVVVDSRWKTRLGGRTNLLDHSARAAASLAYRAVRMGNRVGLISLGGVACWIRPEYGERHFLKLAYAMCSLRPAGFEDLEFLATNLVNVYLTSGQQLILVTPWLDQSCVRAVKKLVQNEFNVIVVSPSPISVERPFLTGGEEQRLAARILELERRKAVEDLSPHARVFDWDVDTALERFVGEMRVAGR